MKSNESNSIVFKAKVHDIKNNSMDICVPGRGKDHLLMVTHEEHEHIDHLRCDEEFRNKEVVALFHKNCFKNKKNVLHTIIFPNDKDYDYWIGRATLETRDLDKPEDVFKYKK